MQIPNIIGLLSIYVESFLKVFKQFNSFGVWSLGVGVWCFRVLLGQIDAVKVLIKMFIFSLKGIRSQLPVEFCFFTT